jgi:uncharacterized protein YifE (UPF0438 family)
MKAPPDHLAFLKRRDFVLCCDDIFNEQERDLLFRYGRWFEALTTNLITPLTPNQVRFLQVDRDEIEPETTFELVWMKLKRRREFEAEQRRSPHYRVYDPSEAWFPRSEHWRYQV